MEVVEKHLVEQFDMFSLGRDLLEGNFVETQVIHSITFKCFLSRHGELVPLDFQKKN